MSIVECLPRFCNSGTNREEARRFSCRGSGSSAACRMFFALGDFAGYQSIYPAVGSIWIGYSIYIFYILCVSSSAFKCAKAWNLWSPIISLVCGPFFDGIPLSGFFNASCVSITKSPTENGQQANTREPRCLSWKGDQVVGRLRCDLRPF